MASASPALRACLWGLTAPGHMPEHMPLLHSVFALKCRFSTSTKADQQNSTSYEMAILPQITLQIHHKQTGAMLQRKALVFVVHKGD